ncbi:hypothetical protein BSKO_08543 [Bryopsis sp. KO-2023]|nr:hypothetical protein BSKO_08543 [Bryopsis sp. KO-2023]
MFRHARGLNFAIGSRFLISAEELGCSTALLDRFPFFDATSSHLLSTNAPQDEKPANQSPSTPSPLIERIAPKQILPYCQLMRWDKPSATWLLAWPCFWSIGLAAPCGSLPDAHLLALFGSGALLLRSAGCTINDMWDRDLDKQVERTLERPLASGAVSMKEAWVLLAGQLSLGLGVLLQLNDYSKLLGAASLALVTTYPLMKRATFWPQAFLGLAMNWGGLLGWAAVRGSCDLSVVLPLYAGGVAWTIVYDTIYACQDIKDDSRIGLKSTALRFGDNVHWWLSGFSVASVLGFGVAGVMADCGPAYYAGLLGVGTHLAWQVASLDVKNGPDCMAKFTSNKWLGSVFFGGIVVDKLMCS